jgi:hypothetical protein
MLNSKMIDMTKFAQWLEANRGMAKQLQIALNVNATTISNVKTGRRRMPPYWMPVVHQLSKGKLGLASLIEENGSKRR